MIATIFISLGIASDNLMLAVMSGDNSNVVKSSKWLVIMFLLITIQLQVLMYGNWLAQSNLLGNAPLIKWVALGMLISMVIKKMQEIKKKHNPTSIPLGLNSFLTVASASSIYIFVLGFALQSLQINDETKYKAVIPSLIFTSLLGWLLGKFQYYKMLFYADYLFIGLLAFGTLFFCFTNFKNS